MSLRCKLGWHDWRYQVQSIQYNSWSPSWVQESVLNFVNWAGCELATGRRRCARCGKCEDLGTVSTAQDLARQLADHNEKKLGG